MIVGFSTTIIWSNYATFNLIISERVTSFIFSIISIYCVSIFLQKMKIKDALKAISMKSSSNVFYLKGNDHFLQDFFIQKVSKIYFKIIFLLGH